MSKIKMQSLFMVLIILAGISIPHSIHAYTPKTYFVSTSGNNSNSGNETSPWKTIQFAVNHVNSGDTILVRAGTYNEKVSIKNKGSEANGYMTIKNYPGERPIINGKNITSSPLLSITNSAYIKVSGIEISNYKADYPIGLRISDGSNHIEIQNCIIHDISTNDPSSNTANPLYIAGNTSTTVNNINIIGNQVYNCQTGWSEGLTINGNVENWAIENNIIHDIGNIGIDAAGHWETGCKDPKLNQARNGIIRGNTVYNCNSPNEDGCAPGIYVDGGKNILIEKNTVHNSDYGISVGCERATDFYNSSYKATTESITVRNNIIHSNYKCGLDVGGYNSKKTGKVINSSILNNTLYNNNRFFHDSDELPLGELSISYSDGLSILNNIIYGVGSNNLLIDNNSVNPVTNLKMNNNLFFTSEGKNKTYFLWKSKLIKGIDSWKSTTGFDKNSKFANPEFFNITSLNFLLLPSSPAIDSGDPSFKTSPDETDYLGVSRIYNNLVDYGAFESQGSISNLAMIAHHYNLKSTDTDWNNIYDLNDDKIVDIYDLIILSKLF